MDSVGLTLSYSLFSVFPVFRTTLRSGGSRRIRWPPVCSSQPNSRSKKGFAMTMTNNPFESELLAIVRHIPRGRVTTYREIAQAIDPRLTRHDVAEWLMASCQETTRLLLRSGHTAPKAALPCWRILDDAAPNRLSAISGQTMETSDPMYPLLVRPLLEDGIPMEPPAYRIPAEYLCRWPELRALIGAEGRVDPAVAHDQLAFFEMRAEEARDLVRAAANLTQHGPYAIGLKDGDPAGFICQMRVSTDFVAIDLASDLWPEIRTIRLRRREEGVDATPPRVNEIDEHIFYLETWLDDGRWSLWAQGADGTWEIPSNLWDVMTEPTDPTREALLSRFMRIAEISAHRIEFYHRPEQWLRSPAPKAAWDPPEVLTHAQLVRTAPFVVRDVQLDDTATIWTFTVESVHFPETVRRVVLCWEMSQHLESRINLPGRVWRELAMRCEAWFDLYYAPTLPNAQRSNAYAQGGWHLQPDGTWLIGRSKMP